MAVFHPHTVKCVCGNPLIVQLADSLNAKRSPKIRERILRGELHRTSCPSCGKCVTVERPFYYTDLSRNAVFKVLPRGERHLWRGASEELDAASSLVPNTLNNAQSRTLRVAFGMDEFREKLVAQDAGLDDRTVELLKVLLIYEHPILLRKSRLRLVLQSVSEDALEFMACYEHHSQRFSLQMPRSIANEIIANEEKVKAWAKQAHPRSGGVYELPDHWVNMWRWSPQPSALEKLRTYAQQMRDRETVDTTSTAFQNMLSGLPRGNHLPSWAKQDLRTVHKFAQEKHLQSLEDQVFEIRFGIQLEDDWSTNDDADDIDTLWQLLENLPDTNVEGNTKIREILLAEGEGGGFYIPQTHDIIIGSELLANREQFEDVVRHEVGHAVHEMHPDRIDNWLNSRFGWRVFGTDNAEIDQWVALMGGWGSLTNAQKAEVRHSLVAALGPGESWSSGPAPTLPANHPWNAAQFGPRLAFENSGANWYENFRTWHRFGDRAFFMNFWYQTFVVVNSSTLDLIDQMPDAYAAMSHYEFFAELYALYYDLDDPMRGNIPLEVGTWLETNIGAPEILPRPSAPRERRAWEDVRRPGKA